MTLPGLPQYNKFYNAQEVTLAAGEERTLSYDFIPDQILIVPRLDSVISDNVQIRPVGAQGGAMLQLRGTGPVVVPGLSKQLYLRNNDLTARVLIVTAQLGYLPISVVMPVTSITAVTAAMDAQTISLFLTNRTSHAFTHNHPNFGSIFLWVDHQKDTGVEPPLAISSVTIAGKSATLVGYQARGSAAVAGEVWEVNNIEAGIVTISIDSWGGGTVNNADCIAISFSAGVVGGNVATDAGGGTVTLINAEAKSAAYCFIGGGGAESGGAEAVISSGTLRSRAFRRTESGSVSFIFAAVAGEAVAFEARLS